MGSVVFCQLPPFEVSKGMGAEEFNLRRTFERTSFALSRLLGNMGVSGSTPLLKRFNEPLGALREPSIVKNGDFSVDSDSDGVADDWEISSGAKGSREALADSGFAQVITAPAGEAGAKPPEVMIDQHSMPIRGGQWYRLSMRVRAEGLSSKEISWTVQNTADWNALFDYKNIQPQAEWKTVSFDLKARNSTDKTGKFQIWFNGAGKLWLADVRLEPIADPTFGRWLEGFYLTKPTEWDDPYRFFGW